MSGLGSQLMLVALPYQVYLLTRSSFMVGRLGLVEFVPLAVFALVGGALADRIDRRRLLMRSQLLLLSTSAALALASPPRGPAPCPSPLPAALAAGGSAIDSAPPAPPSSRSWWVRSRLRSAISFNYGLFQLTVVVGPAVGGLVIAGLDSAGSDGHRRRHLRSDGRQRARDPRRSRPRRQPSPSRSWVLLTQRPPLRRAAPASRRQASPPALAYDLRHAQGAVPGAVANRLRQRRGGRRARSTRRWCPAPWSPPSRPGWLVRSANGWAGIRGGWRC